MRALVLSLVPICAACRTTDDTMHYMDEEGPGGPNSFRVAALHISPKQGPAPTPEDAARHYRENFELIAPLIRMAARAGAKVIAGPEYGNSGSFLSTRHYLQNFSSRLPAAPTKRPLHEMEVEGLLAYLIDYSRLAAETETYLVTHVLEVAEKEGRDVYYNSMVAFDPEGRLLARYRKQARWLAEAGAMEKGDEAVSFDTPYGRFGMLICYDAMFPSSWADLVCEHDVDFIVCPTLWPQAPLTPRMGINLLSTFTGVPVIWANQRRQAFGGDAGIVRPWEADTTIGHFGPTAVVVANLALPERLRSEALEARVGQ